ncbi:hypothetical protein SDRG_03992 [Saprolegnia diclina VS20]|uniref:Ankyrin repeat protein n=1 Tax=Saprolegnia diclina (strain VS20) TaxID=1156394 RepID=T0QYB9_SAPDV|nr:hypothetical protein SDRG_03992 [Saprolegnia diclina VS20]EQC39040.1 hypothetical protein SDRG_03992 [Saprolegnia diclina VS20]|eukprot:XP_008607864.1 hypothetical protein SDRG_03992 [Saprolegnia diclina VS20]
MMYSNGASISGHMRHLAVAACLGGHVDLLRFAIESDDSPALSSLKPIALRAGRLCVVQVLFEKGVISKFKARDMRLAVATGRVDLVAFLLDSSSHGMVAEAFKQATTQCQIALLKWLCTTYNEPLYWRIALQVAVADLQHDVIAYFATTHNLHITPDEAARVHRRRKRHDEDAPTRQTRSRN